MLDRNLDERRSVVRDIELGARWQVTRQLGKLGLHQGRGFHGVGAGRQLHAEGTGGFAVQARAVLILLAADLDPGDIANGQARTVRIGTQDNVFELLHRAQLALDHHVGGNFLAAGGG
ncbi:hypothetical protein D3C76_1200680 [compost metagenome]